MKRDLEQDVRSILSDGKVSSRDMKVLESIISQIESGDKVYPVQKRLVERLMRFRTEEGTSNSKVKERTDDSPIIGNTKDPFLKKTRKEGRAAIRKWIKKDKNGCWIVQRVPNKVGFVWIPKFGLAYRLAFWSFKGDILLGMSLRHTCKNKACANPDHLEAHGTVKDKSNPNWY